ncbi:MAG: hypothetical protein K8S62_04355 [Candidatus Sabulitectum sp.]|nr:hypothetical protein [Candidatus Sabulitectum sp.]
MFQYRSFNLRELDSAGGWSIKYCGTTIRQGAYFERIVEKYQNMSNKNRSFDIKSWKNAGIEAI